MTDTPTGVTPERVAQRLEAICDEWSGIDPDTSHAVEQVARQLLTEVERLRAEADAAARIIDKLTDEQLRRQPCYDADGWTWSRELLEVEGEEADDDCGWERMTAEEADYFDRLALRMAGHRPEAKAPCLSVFLVGDTEHSCVQPQGHEGYHSAPGDGRVVCWANEGEDYPGSEGER